jgi:hypothetical protein
MDVRTQMRSAAHDNAHHEAVAAGERRLTFAEAWRRGVRLPTNFLHWTSVLTTGPAMTTRLSPVRVPLHLRNARESHLHMLAHTGRRASVASIVA